MGRSAHGNGKSPDFFYTKKKMEKTAENKITETILQLPMTIEIGPDTYEVAPPCLATFILVSSEISKLPDVKPDAKNILLESLAIAADCVAIGDIIAILILGAKGLKKTVVEKSSRFFGLIRDERIYERDLKAELAEKVLLELSAEKLGDVLGKLLSNLNPAFFFATIDSLIEVNLLRAEKKKTTVSGH
jgi:hypothetical protein